MDLSIHLSELESSDDSPYLRPKRDGELSYMRQHAWRFRRLLARMPRLAGPRRVLDIGPTPFTLILQREFPNWEMWAMDRSDHLRGHFERAGIRFLAGDLEQLHVPLQENLFDLVICTEVLEHVFAPPTLVLREILRIIRPCGSLLLTVPNLANLRKRLRFLLGISPLENPDTQLATRACGHGHVREYTRKEIVTACRSAGFDVTRVRMEWKSPADILRLIAENRRDLLRRGFYLGKLLHSLVNLVMPSVRGNILVMCRKPGLPVALEQRAAAPGNGPSAARGALDRTARKSA